MPAAKNTGTYIATTSGVAANPKTGEELTYVKGKTLVREGHWLLKSVPDAFETTGDRVHYETATDAPTLAHLGGARAEG